MRGQRLVQGRCNGEVVYGARTAAVCANGSNNHHYSTEPPQYLPCQDEINYIQLISEQKKTVFRGPLYFVDSFFSLFRQNKNWRASFSPGKIAKDKLKVLAGLDHVVRSRSILFEQHTNQTMTTSTKSLSSVSIKRAIQKGPTWHTRRLDCYWL